MFNTVKRPRLKSSNFDLSHEHKLTTNMGLLYPTALKEVLPGDFFNCNTEILVRLAPTLAPVYQKIDVFVHWFFVPNRLIWDDWEDFITETKTYTVPHYDHSESYGATIKGNLGDAFGVGDLIAGTQDRVTLSKLPFRAYNMIWNEFYRDQNLQDERDLDNVTLARRAWSKDYFTSGLPTTQRGAETTVPLNAASLNRFDYDNRMSTTVDNESGGNVNPAPAGTLGVNASGNQYVMNAGAGNPEVYNKNLRNDSLGEDVSFSISDLRISEALQKWKERSMRVGQRYTEYLLGFWNSRSGDARLNRPEFLGGGKQSVNVSEVMQTATDAANDQFTGDMYGHGYALGANNNFVKKFVEHGHVMAIISVMPKASYFQGVDRAFSRETVFDFAHPDLAHIGEQAIFNKELLASSSTPDDVFAYQSRYAEYKYGKPITSGDFKESLKFWHLGREFANQPLLNEDFITCNPSNRIFSVTDAGVDHLWIQVYNKMLVRRQLPYYSNPRLI
jgi:hypothetical protein